jgi:hypothetical protein
MDNEKPSEDTIATTEKFWIIILLIVVVALLAGTLYSVFVDDEQLYYLTHSDAVAHCHRVVVNTSECYGAMEKDRSGWTKVEYCNIVEQCTAKNRDVIYSDRSLGFCKKQRLNQYYCPSEHTISVTVNIK